mmetsp:Transcript_37114/g.86404  ORF Transcript_37114/g.86404 Transcript_37114/m.86404 type:complete len:233 (-) Transcript_37114:77-775(-)
MGLEHRDLIIGRGVHHEVCAVLVGEDPDALSPSHVVPARQCHRRRLPAEEEVAAHAPQQPVVCGLNDVGVVQLQHRQGGYKDLEEHAPIDSLGIEWVQSVDALDHENAFGRQARERHALRLTVARLHVVHGRRYGLPAYERVDVLAHKLHIHGFHMVVVHVGAQVPRLVFGLPVKRQVVVVHSQRLRLTANVLEVHAELRGKGRLARGCRPSDAHHPHRLAAVPALQDARGD